MSTVVQINTAANPAYVEIPDASGGRSQSQQAVFTGAEAFVDLTWTDLYTRFTLSFLPSAIDGSSVAINFTKVGDPTSLPTNAGIRVIPTAPFTGVVYVTITELLP